MDLIYSSSDWLASRTKFIHHYYITCIQIVGDRVEKKNAFLDPLHHSSEPQWILWRLIYLNLPSTHLYSIKPTKNLCFFPPPSNPLPPVIGPVPFLQRRERTSARACCVCVRVYVNETTKQLIRSRWLTDACASLSRSIAERWTVRDTDGSKPWKSKNFRRVLLFYTDLKAPGCPGSYHLASTLEEEPHECIKSVDMHNYKGNSGCVGNAGISATIMIGTESVALMSLKLIAMALSSWCSYSLSVRKTSRGCPCVCRSHRNG